LIASDLENGGSNRNARSLCDDCVSALDDIDIASRLAWPIPAWKRYCRLESTSRKDWERVNE